MKDSMRQTALIVEDDPGTRHVLSSTLATAGIDSIHAATGAAMWQQLDHAPDIIILDLSLPDGDGLELLRQLRQTSDVPVLIHSRRSDEIERIIKLPWKPNLNDGVLITASPLHNLFRLPKWKKDLKACWDELAKGDYDWAHLAYSIWPQRVERACERDRSLAIAHGLEHLCKVEPPKPKAKRAAKKVAIPKESNPDLPIND